jgi:hypothetical protein
VKKWGLVIAVLAILFGGAYFGSAYLAASHFKHAALSADADQLDATVDFPAVRESLKSQFSAMLTKKMQNDPDMKGNPFAGLGMMLVPVVIDKAVDVYVTPDGISAMVEGEKPNSGQPKGDNPDIKATHEWVTLDRFRVNLTNTKTHADGASLLFERRGLFSWKLIKVGLPDTLMDSPTPGSANTAAASEPGQP